MNDVVDVASFHHWDALSGVLPGIKSSHASPDDHIPNPPCTATGAPSSVCPGATGYVSDSASGYTAAGPGFWTELPSLTRFHIDNVPYKSASSSSTQTSLGGICGADESGYRVNGHLTAPVANAGDHTRLTLCLDSDTGPGTTGNFAADIAAELGGDSSMTISTVSLDPTSSALKIT